MDSLHRRLGDIRNTQDVDIADTKGEAFARVYGSTSSYTSNIGFSRYGYNADQDYTALQFGSNATLHNDNGATLRLGGAITLGHSRLTPDAADGNSVTKTDTQSISAIGTYQHPAGWYVDVILSAGNLRGKTRTANFGNHTVATIKGRTYAASIEAGYPFALGDSGFNLEPQIQYSWQNLRFRDFTDADGIRTHLGHQNQSTLRVGARLTRPYDTKDGTQITPYARVNYLQSLSGNHGNVTVGSVEFPYGKFGRAVQVGAGVSGMVNKRLSVYGEFSWQDNLGSSGWKGWQFTGGIRYMFGG